MRWIKLYVNESLRGSIRFDLSMEEQGIWFNLLLLAGDSRNPGVIQQAIGIAYPDNFIAAQLRISPKTLVLCLAKLVKQRRIIIDQAGITVVNWERYQTVQKQYKQKEAAAELAADTPAPAPRKPRWKEPV